MFNIVFFNSHFIQNITESTFQMGAILIILSFQCLSFLASTSQFTKLIHHSIRTLNENNFGFFNPKKGSKLQIRLG